MKTAIELIADERSEQITKHGFTKEHDLDVNSSGQLMAAAEAVIDGDDSQFPANWDLTWVQRMCDKPRVKRLIISGALLEAQKEIIQYRINEIAAEIDRLNSNKQ